LLGLVGFELDGHTVLLLGEIALALVLFTDAASINLSALGSAKLADETQ
jgi:hypothetical protein